MALWGLAGKMGAICVDPVVSGGQLFITSAETHLQGTRFSIRGRTLVEDWSNNKLSVYTGSCVYLDGFLTVSTNGILRCLDWDQGEERWAQRGFGGHASLMAADGKLLVQTYRSGELVVVEAVPADYRELRRVKVFPDTARPSRRPSCRTAEFTVGAMMAKWCASQWHPTTPHSRLGYRR